VDALRGITLKVKPAEFVFLVGPTGSGKSTFLKLLYLEERALSGTVTVSGQNVDTLRGRDIPRFRRRIGVVFQDFRLLPYKTAWENVAFALQVTGARTRDIHERVPAILNMVGLGGKAKCFPEQLSGGEQQRVCIARALVNAPPLLLADEPTGNLDPATSLEIFTLLDAIHRAGTTVVIATHDAQMVDRLQKRVLVFENGLITRDDRTGGYEASEESLLNGGAVHANHIEVRGDDLAGKAVGA
jgi:cell division transport system ATP-binding protein